ncbi:hypothetical protein pb186bvf_004688 [Paramecium bursaria]
MYILFIILACWSKEIPKLILKYNLQEQAFNLIDQGKLVGNQNNMITIDQLNQYLVFDASLNDEEQQLDLVIDFELLNKTGIAMEPEKQIKLQLKKNTTKFNISFDCLSEGEYLIDFNATIKEEKFPFKFKKICKNINYTDFLNLTKSETIKNDIIQQNISVNLIKNASLILKTKKQDQCPEIKEQELWMEYGQKQNISINYNCTLCNNRTGNFSFKDEYELEFSSYQEKPFKQKFKIDCEPISIRTFDVIIGTRRGTSDIYTADKVRPEFSFDVYENQSKAIQPYEGAFQTYIQVNENNTKKLNFTSLELKYEQNNLVIDYHIQNKTSYPDKIIFMFHCKQKSQNFVSISYHFTFGEDVKEKKIDFQIIKLCDDPPHLRPHSYFNDMLYYIICIIAIIFGIYVIKLFKIKGLMMAEANEQNLTIDTSYKKKYQEMPEIVFDK